MQPSRSDKGPRRRGGGLAVRGKHTVAWGVVISVVLLALGLAIPWQGVAFPGNLAWQWIPIVVGVAVAFLPSRYFVLWLVAALVIVVVVLSWSVPLRLVPIMLLYFAGVEIGSTVRLVVGARRGEAGSGRDAAGRDAGGRDAAGRDAAGRAVQAGSAGAAPDALIIGVYPRDDVRWSDDGVARSGSVEVRAGTGGGLTGEESLSRSIAMGDFAPFSPALTVGSSFELLIAATYGGDSYRQSFRFQVSGDENDVSHYTVGPGMQVERTRGARTTAGGFEFGATVMGARLADPE